MLAELPLTDFEVSQISGLPLSVIHERIMDGSISMSVHHPYRVDLAHSRPNPYDIAVFLARLAQVDKEDLCSELERVEESFDSNTRLSHVIFRCREVLQITSIAA